MKTNEVGEMSAVTDLKAKVKELLDSANSNIENSFFGSEFEEEISKYDEEEDVAFKTALRESGLTVKHVDRYGGEDMGSEYWSVYMFSNANEAVYVKFSGSYYSYDGSTFDEWFFAKPVPKSGFDYVAE